MPTISSAFHVSLISIIADDFQADLFRCLSLIGILNSHLLNILIYLHSHVIFAFFPTIKKSLSLVSSSHFISVISNL